MRSGVLARDTGEVIDIPTETVTGSAAMGTVVPIRAAFQATADMVQMGEWSSDCVVQKWPDTFTGPANSAKFKGDVVADSGPVTLKRWVMSSEVIDAKLHAEFEFIAAECSTWRCEFTKRDGAAAMTKSFSYPRRAGLPKWAGGRLLDGSEEMSPGMQAALNCTETSLRR